MAKGKKKRRRVPEVLWRLFHHKARTLMDTVLSLLPSPPPPPPHCLCKGCRCLGCSGDKTMSFLIRPKDPPEYRKLLNHCFIVIPDQATPFTGFDPHNRWPQLEAVRRCIEMIICDQPASQNVLCGGYDKNNRSSSMVDQLTSPAWCLLLRRVGDSLMVYLLRNTLIFLPLPSTKYHQVAGSPISDLCTAFIRHSSKFINPPSKSHLESGKKRKRDDGADVRENLESPSICGTDISSIPSCIGCSAGNDFTPSTRCCLQNFSKKSKIHATALASVTKHFQTEVSSPLEFQESSSQAMVPKKRVREYSWQRRRKRGHLSSQDCGPSILYTCSPSDRKNSRVGLHDEAHTYSSLHSLEARCSCCLVFQTLPKVFRKTQIDRQSMFYKMENRASIFPKKHILNSLKPNNSGANVLFREIFGSDVHFSVPLVPCAHSTNSCFMKSTCLFHSLIKQLKLLMRKIRGCQFLRLLDKHCGISSLDQHSKTDSETCTETPKAHEYQFQPCNGYCSKKQVVSFLWAVCRSIVPVDLLGSPYNWRILRKNISKFVCLRRFEKFSLKEGTQNLKMSEFPLLSNKHSLCYVNSSDFSYGKRDRIGMPNNCNKQNAAGAVRHRLLQCWISWIFSDLLVPLLETHFYITESETGKQELYYYRRTVWQKLKDQALLTLKDRGYHELTNASLHRILKNRSFGFSKIRFRPKDTGFRILANLRAPSRIPVKSFSKSSLSSSSKMSINQRNVKYKYFKSVNSFLQGVHVLLKGIQMKEPEKLGSSVFDYTDVYKKFVPFLNLLKQGSSIIPAVYIIVSDVSKAFDSIDQNVLLKVMEDVISNDEYPLNKSLQVGCTRRTFMVRHHLMSPLQEPNHQFSSAATSVPISTPHGILIKEEQSTMMTKLEIIFHLKEHITRNVLKFGQKFYMQRVGITQGSILSSLLCSYYYGHLEKNVIFPFLEKAGQLASRDSVTEQSLHQTPATAIHPVKGPELLNSEYMLLRFIDDFLFISTSKKQASLFFSRLQRGFRGYNCYMNERKFGLNFDMENVAEHESNRVYVGGDGIVFLRWSGLLVNSSTLEIQADYSRYLNCHLSTSLSLSWSDHPARLLKCKLSGYLRPKCHPIFYDSIINSAAVIRLNIYQAFLLCAMKFNCYICNFSGISAFGSKPCMDAIEASLSYMHKLIRRRMQVLRAGSGFRPIFSVGKREVKWLGLTAFVRALSRKQSRYTELLLMLRSNLEVYEEAGISAPLKYAVDDAHSSVLWKIKY